MPNNTYSGVSYQAQTFYDKNLLKRLLPSLQFMKYGQKKPIPKNEGATVNYRRFTRLTPATTPLQEGVTPNGRLAAVEAVTATVQGYGDYIITTDLLDMAGIDPVVTEMTDVLGEQAGETLDEVVRDVVGAGTNVYYVGGGVARNTVAAANIFDGATARRIRRIMMRNNVKPLPGKGGAAFVAFIHPDAAYDIQGDAAWVNAKHYASPEAIENGEIGMLYGVRYIETTKAPVYDNAGVANIDVYGKEKS